MKYSEADRLATIGNNDLVAIGHEDAQGATGYVSGVSSITEIGEKINNNLEYSTALETTDKKIIGAINEVNAKAGSLDITSKIDTPAPVMSFADGGNNIPVKSLVTEILPYQSGSGTPSPTNVRSISGHSSCSITRTANANLFGGSKLLSNFQIAVPDCIVDTINKTVYFNSSDTQAQPIVSGIFKENTQYSFIITGIRAGGSSTSKSANLRIYYTDGTRDDFTFNNREVKDTFVFVSASGKTVKDFRKANASGNTTLYYGECGIFEGVKIASDFVDYNGDDYIIPLGQTIYGASLECVQGKGTVTKGAIKLNDLQWQLRTSGSDNPNGTKFNASGDFSMVKGSGIGEADIICNVAVEGNGNYATSGANTIWFSNSRTTMGWIWGSPNQGSTLTDLENFLNNNDVWVVFDLATETSLSVSGANIPTFAGQNNIYNDCGNIQSIEYYNSKADESADMDKAIGKHSYSLDEQIVGWWIDGRPIYEKTVYGAGGVTGDFTITHGISNLDRVLSYTGSVNDTQYSTYGDKWVLPRMANPFIGIDSVTSTVIKVINPSAFSTRLVDWYITLRYIKT